MDIRKIFNQFSKWASHHAGRPSAFILAVTIVLVWAAMGPLFHFSDTWQLVVNTGTTIVTFLMVFLIQNSQNRDTASIQIKLDELIRANEKARNAILDLEELDEAELERIREGYEHLAHRAGQQLKQRRAGRHER